MSAVTLRSAVDGKPWVTVQAVVERGGLAVTPNVDKGVRKGRYMVTHIKSGRWAAGGLGTSLRAAKRALEAFLALPIDWTKSMTDVRRQARAHMPAIIDIRAAARGSK